jgi:hypothetical protein
MSTSVDTAFVVQFGDDVFHLSQQMDSRLRNAVDVDEGVVGEMARYDRLGTKDMQERLTRHGDTPFMDVEHTRRQVDLADFEWNTYLDNLDKLKLLIDPASEYQVSARASAGRRFDDTIIAAANGTAKTGKTGSGSQALTTAQKILVASAGLTLAKIISSSKILNKAEVEKTDRFLAYGAEQLEDVLGDGTITSADYNTARLLQSGDIDTFMGYTWINSERLALDGSSNRLLLAWQRRGIKLAVGMDTMSRIDERNDKSYATQVYFSMSLGAVRMEEESVVQIACLDT